MPAFKFVVFSNAVAGREAEFNEWYDQTHLDEVLEVPGFVDARRFRIVGAGDTPPEHAYLAIYDMVTDDAPATLAELTRRAESGELAMSDSLAGDARTLLVEELPRTGRPA